MNQNDPFAFIFELCYISPSQQELLSRCPFVGQTVNLHHDGASPSSGRIPVASTGIVNGKVSSTETPQEGGKDSSGGPQDVFHTPPEGSSLPTSGDQLRSVAFDHCTVNQSVNVDDETLGFVDFCGYTEGTEFVDLSIDSDLGFPEIKLRQRVDRELVAECSHGLNEAGVCEISKCEFNKFRLLERELSLKDGLGELPLKKVKLSEQHSGFDYPQPCFEIKLQNVGEDMRNCERKLVSNTGSPCKVGADTQPQQNVLIGEEMSLGVGDEQNAYGEMSVEKNLGSRENLGSQIIQSEIARRAGNFSFDDIEERVEDGESREGICEADKLPCTGEGNKSTDEVVETSKTQKRTDKQPEISERQKIADKQPGVRVLPSSFPGFRESTVKELESEKGRKEQNTSIYDVLKVLKENSDEDGLQNVSLLEIAKIRGITFDSPRWWKEKGK